MLASLIKSIVVSLKSPTAPPTPFNIPAKAPMRPDNAPLPLHPAQPLTPALVPSYLAACAVETRQHQAEEARRALVAYINAVTPGLLLAGAVAQAQGTDRTPADVLTEWADRWRSMAAELPGVREQVAEARRADAVERNALDERVYRRLECARAVIPKLVHMNSPAYQPVQPLASRYEVDGTGLTQEEVAIVLERRSRDLAAERVKRAELIARWSREIPLMTAFLDDPLRDRAKLGPLRAVLEGPHWFGGPELPSWGHARPEPLPLDDAPADAPADAPTAALAAA